MIFKDDLNKLDHWGCVPKNFDGLPEVFFRKNENILNWISNSDQHVYNFEYDGEHWINKSNQKTANSEFIRICFAIAHESIDMCESISLKCIEVDYDH